MFFDLVHHFGGEARVCAAFGLGKAAPVHDATAGEQPVTGRLYDGFGLAGRDGFVDLQPPFLPNAVGADGIACGQHRRVTLAKLLRADALLLAAAHDRHGRLRQQRQPLNLPLGADLLHNADGGVDKNDENEQKIPPRADSRQCNGDHQIQRVEAGANVVPQNTRDRFCGIVHENSPLTFAFHILTRRRAAKVSEKNQLVKKSEGTF